MFSPLLFCSVTTKLYRFLFSEASKAKVPEEATVVDERRSCEYLRTDLEEKKEELTAKVKEMFSEFQPILKLQELQREDAERRANELGEMSSVIFANYYSLCKDQPLIEPTVTLPQNNLYACQSKIFKLRSKIFF